MAMKSSSAFCPILFCLFSLTTFGCAERNRALPEQVATVSAFRLSDFGSVGIEVNRDSMALRDNMLDVSDPRTIELLMYVGLEQAFKERGISLPAVAPGKAPDPEKPMLLIRVVEMEVISARWYPDPLVGLGNEGPGLRMSIDVVDPRTGTILMRFVDSAQSIMKSEVTVADVVPRVAKRLAKALPN